MILLEEVIVRPPVLKNVFDETAWGPPRGHVSEEQLEARLFPPLSPKDPGARKPALLSCAITPLISLRSGRGKLTAH